MRLEVQPITLKEAWAFVREHHRHLPKSPPSWRFGLAVSSAGRVVGVAMCGRPVARGFDDGWTVEVNRLCTDGTEHAASKLYGHAVRAARALGYRRLVTYTLLSEPGTSLRAAGWRELRLTDPRGDRTWSCSSRPRVDHGPVGQKRLWEVAV